MGCDEPWIQRTFFQCPIGVDASVVSVLIFCPSVFTVVASMDDVEDVLVEEDTVSHSNTKAFHVVIKFTNYSIGVTQTAFIGDSR